ncbi:MAG: hypothetical protein FWC70_11830 [Defluviitaleaceae bacterium]|nr:hypothetical protein [Defluviitaleaceae bacterium]
MGIIKRTSSELGTARFQIKVRYIPEECMSYLSIDKLQNLLSKSTFSHAASSKKAAGRALGTIVEIVAFYLIKAWGHEYRTAIERPLPEYANTEIVHNVEFTFHHSKLLDIISAVPNATVSSTFIFNNAKLPSSFQKTKSARNLLKDDVLKNACTIAFSGSSFCNAYFSGDRKNIQIYELSDKPYAMFECKRVGVEEGMKKGPQTIEKAKQGSYVARSVSSVQRVRLNNGKIGAAIERSGGFEFFDDYYAFIENAVFKHDIDLLKNFILTVGIVSNHGNWFTSDNQNKEMKVLSQSYDWLLFLTDEGLASFIQNVISGNDEFGAVKNAFEKSYEKEKKSNRFTKTNMDCEADAVLTAYFIDNLPEIETWFNVIAPKERNIRVLNEMLIILSGLEV